MAMAKTPSLNASRRFFLCLIFAGFFSSAISSPHRAPAGRSQGRRRFRVELTAGGLTCPVARPPVTLC